MAEPGVRLTFNADAIEKLLTSPAMEVELKKRAERIAAAANSESSWGGYYAASSREGSRARARVWNVKREAADDEARNNRLLRGLDAGR